MPQFIIIGIWLHFMKKLKGKADLHGSAHWATCEEIEKMGYLGGVGVYVGGYVKRLAGAALLSAMLSGNGVTPAQGRAVARCILKAEGLV